MFIHVHVDVHPSKRDNTHWPAVSWVDVNQPFPALLLGKRYRSKKNSCLDGKTLTSHRFSEKSDELGPTIKSNLIMKSKKSNQSNQGLQFHRLPDLYRLHHLEHRYLVVPDDPGRRGLQGPGGDPAQPAPRCGAGEGAAALPGAAGGRLDGGGVFGHRGWAVGVAKDQ